MKFDIPRKRLREMGVPEDMSADDVVAFFSLPDDDMMHQQSTASRSITADRYPDPLASWRDWKW